MGGNYYDHLGLMALCEAIDDIEGITFKPLSAKPRYYSNISGLPTSPESPVGTGGSRVDAFANSIAATADGSQGLVLPGPYPLVAHSATGQHPYPQHALLVHVPLTMTSSATAGTESYEQEQIQAYKSAQTSLNQSGAGGLRSGSVATSLSGNPAHSQIGMGRVPSVTYNTPHMATGVPQEAAASGVASSNPMHMRQRSAAPMAPVTPINPMAAMNSMAPTASVPSVVPHGAPPPPPVTAVPRPTVHQRSASTHSASASVSPGPGGTGDGDLSNGSVTSVGNFRIESCPLCGRAFKGPKASTHCQQHIRRLHPEHYTPKRGGKKRVGS